MKRVLLATAIGFLAATGCTTQAQPCATMDVVPGPFVLFRGAYTVPLGVDVSFEQSALAAITQLRGAIGAHQWTDAQSLIASGTTLSGLLARLDAEFVGPDAATLPYSPSRMLGDAIAAGAASATPGDAAAASAAALAAVRTMVLLAIESEENLAVSEIPIVLMGDAGTDLAGATCGGDAGTVSWGDATTHWNRAAVYFSAIEDDVRAISGASASGVWCVANCAFASDDVAGDIIGVLTRANLAFTSVLPPVPDNIVRTIFESGAALRWTTTKPFFLSAVAAAANPSAPGAQRVGAIATEAVLLTTTARIPGFDASAARQVWLGAAPPTPDAVVASCALAYSAASASAVAEFASSPTMCGSYADLARWEPLAIEGALVETLREAFGAHGIDAASLDAGVAQGRIDAGRGNCATAAVAIRNVDAAVHALAGAGGP